MFLNSTTMVKKVAETKKETSKVEEVKVKKVQEPKVVTDDVIAIELSITEPPKKESNERDIDLIISEFVPILTIDNKRKIEVIEAIKEGKSKEEIVYLMDLIDTFDKHRIELVKNLL